MGLGIRGRNNMRNNKYSHASILSFDTFDEQVFVICNKIILIYLCPSVGMTVHEGWVQATSLLQSHSNPNHTQSIWLLCREKH